MALVAGSITVASDGTYTGSGIAAALMAGEVAQLDYNVATLLADNA